MSLLYFLIICDGSPKWLDTYLRGVCVSMGMSRTSHNQFMLFQMTTLENGFRVTSSTLYVSLEIMQWRFNTIRNGFRVTFKSSSVFNSIRSYFTFPSLSIQSAQISILLTFMFSVSGNISFNLYLKTARHVVPSGSRNSTGDFNKVGIRLCLKQKLRYYKIFFLTIPDPIYITLDSLWITQNGRCNHNRIKLSVKL